MKKLSNAAALFPADQVAVLAVYGGAYAALMGAYVGLGQMIVWTLGGFADPRYWDLFIAGGVLMGFWLGVMLLPRAAAALFALAGPAARPAETGSAGDDAAQKDPSPYRVAAE